MTELLRKHQRAVRITTDAEKFTRDECNYVYTDRSGIIEPTSLACAATARKESGRRSPYDGDDDSCSSRASSADGTGAVVFLG